MTTTPAPGATRLAETFGLAASEASLASSLEGATPMLQVSESSTLMSRRSAPATAAEGPNNRSEPVTSRNASSNEMGSTRGV